MPNVIFNRMASSVAAARLNYYTGATLLPTETPALFSSFITKSGSLCGTSGNKNKQPLLQHAVRSNTKALLTVASIGSVLARSWRRHCRPHISREKATLRLHFWHFVRSVIERVCFGGSGHVCVRACVRGGGGGGGHPVAW